MDSQCERREEIVVSLLYDEGDPRELAEARAHIAACAECRQEYESLIGTRELLSAWPNVSNVPRIVYVTDPTDLVSRVRRWVNEMGGLGLKSLLRPAIATAAVFLVMVVGVSLLRFEVSPEGILQVGFGKRDTDPATMAEGSPGPAGQSDIIPISREEFTSAMEDMAVLLDELMQNTRAQDRQFILAEKKIFVPYGGFRYRVDHRLHRNGHARADLRRGTRAENRAGPHPHVSGGRAEAPQGIGRPAGQAGR